MRHDREILLACALGRETRSLRKQLAKAFQLRWLSTGLGGRRTAAALRREFQLSRPPCMIFSGIAGQLDPELEMGEVVIPSRWRLENGVQIPASPGLIECLQPAATAPCTTGLTVNLPVLRPAQRRALWRQHSAGICDMESAFALQVAYDFAVPAAAVKVISDTAGSGFRDFWKSLDHNLHILGTSLEGVIDGLARFQAPEAT